MLLLLLQPAAAGTCGTLTANKKCQTNSDAGTTTLTSNCNDGDGNSAVCTTVAACEAACEASNLEVAQLLLERGANINHQNSQGMAALHAALQFSIVEIAKLLLERGADKDLRDNDGDGVDYYVNAAKHNQEELRALLARY